MQSQPQQLDSTELAALADFKNFLYIVWKFLGLPVPTPVQYDIADYLQFGPERSIIQAFRGVGKSYVTSAYAVWRLLLNPELKIMVVSASKTRADDFSTFTQRLIAEIPLLQHLQPRGDQRASKIAFDVGPATASHSPSVKSVGITGQLAGSRADLIIADDIEIPTNSATQDLRDKLSEAVKEFDAVLKPGGRVVYLGTPQCEMSLYGALRNRGYQTRIWPARYPKPEMMTYFQDVLAPKYLETLENSPEIAWKPTDPKRFDEQELEKRELSYGKAGFALQFMLDTSLSDAERYPLKVADLMVMDLNPVKAPDQLFYGRSPDLEVLELSDRNLAMAGDKFYRPMRLSEHWMEYQGTVMAVDPSGRGADETAYAVVKIIDSQLFVTRAGGIQGGYSDTVLQSLADIAKEQHVNNIIVEDNFGDGMFTELFKPYIARTHPCAIDGVKHSVQKERRIIDTLEPVMAQHKLIFDRKIVEDDFNSCSIYPAENRYARSLISQMTRITYDRGALKHDDRLDALAIAVKYWTDRMAADVTKQADKRRTVELEAELKKFVKGSTGSIAGISSLNMGRSRGRSGWKVR
ncbi:phage terminase large subunit [Bacterioplanoides sp.]|uniref:phage terminase large subunit n=1 Tax=Bacterioplanoides sp. TaxID=2066072 RepID=UPI003AFF8C93